MASRARSAPLFTVTGALAKLAVGEDVVGVRYVPVSNTPWPESPLRAAAPDGLGPSPICGRIEMMPLVPVMCPPVPRHSPRAR